MHCYLQLQMLTTNQPSRASRDHGALRSKMAERIRQSSSSSRFPGLIIANVVFTDTQLGTGAYATVYEVEWNGTLCAAKRLHEILLEDQSSGGVAKLIGNFEAECETWSKLRHPGVVQFLGVHLDRSSRLPVLVMEKMDTSLRTYLEDHSKEEFPLKMKAFVLRQVSQALAYLHNQNPPLVHHDMSTNNVLLNVVSFMTKVSDFGMSRAINPSALSRKSSIKGTLAFMAPEALQIPPRYNEKLDVFSFGSVILHTLTHEWPNPGPPNRYQGDQLVALSELQRREHCTELFTAQEKQLFLPIVHQCLENRPDKRPSSMKLVQELRRIESSLPTGSHVAVTIEQLRQQLSAKEKECRQKDEVIRENDNSLMERDAALATKDEMIQSKVDVIQGKDEALQHLHRVILEKEKEMAEMVEVIRENVIISEIQQQFVANEVECGQKDEVVREKTATIQMQQAEIQRLKDQLAVLQKVS